MTAVSAAYFPSVEFSLDVSSDEEFSCTERPTSIAPVFDSESCARPLDGHDDIFFECNYGSPDLEENGDNPAPAPPKPTGFDDPYLYPTMNKNERLRLTMLWYMMRDALQDQGLLSRLQEKVNLVRDFIGWEYCIMGVVDNAHFTRVVTAGIPLAVVPRRESTCSHTINQPNGSIFWISDLSMDWRFSQSPPVAKGGLKSYAGTALLCHTIDGSEVPLGSLCVASNEPNRGLSATQRKALKKVAHMLVKEMINARRLARQHQRQKMTDTLYKLEEQVESPDFDSALLSVVRSFYPDTEVSLREVTDGVLTLQDGSALSVSDAQNGLWENVDLVEELLRDQNHTPLTTPKTVRAIISQARTFAQGIFLAIETSRVSMIFDDVDAWFVERCARLCWDASQRRLLVEAMQAKDTFLRGITHQLRTPIHGILGAAELLVEELAINTSGTASESNGERGHQRAPHSPTASTDSTALATSTELTTPAANGTIESESHLIEVQKSVKRSIPKKSLQFIETINSAGRELMMTVNNILKLNRWAEITTALKYEPVVCDLEQLESELVKELGESLSIKEVMDVSLIFDNQLEVGYEIRTTDSSLLRDCVQALIVNGIQWAPTGIVTVTIKRLETTLWIDVADNGHGIPTQYQGLIFQPYEKVDQHTRGAGLGLTLASRITEALGGRLSLIWSKVGEGSKFSVELPNAVLSCVSEQQPQIQPVVPRQAAKCKVMSNDSGRVHSLTAHLSKFIESNGFNDDSDHADMAVELDIIDFSPDIKTLEDRFEAADPERFTACVVPSEAFMRTINLEKYNKNIRVFHGPLTTGRLKDITQKLSELHSKRVIANSELCTKSTSNRVVPKLETVSTHRGPTSPIALLVDDNSINLTILRMFCRKRGIPYHEATDGEQAVQKFSTHRDPPINLILMDLQMPVCDGLQATSRIREIEAAEGLQPAAIFMVTGQDSPKDKADSLRAGADEFMVKPVKMKALDETILAHLGSPAGSTPT